jgi:hypothetical protein
MAIAPTTLVKAIVEQTERSMPPVIRTTVWPVATMRSGRRVARMFLRFSEEANLGVMGSRARK